VVESRKRGDVAIIHRSSPTQSFAGIETDEAKANAALISAAPELYEALEKFVALANFDADTVPKTNEEWDAMVKAGESALAKARGETQEAEAL